MIRIALADDHTLFRKGIAHLLSEEADMQVVVEAQSGNELLAMLRKQKELPQVCILDVNMRDGNGQETLRQLRKDYPQLGVLILTMLDHESLILQMLRLGAGGYLLKEDEPEDMIRAVRAIVAHGFYHTDLVSGSMRGRLQNGGRTAPANITEREYEFLKLCVSDLAYKEMAHQMGVGLRTVQGYRDSLFEKLQIKSRTGLALYAIQTGISPIGA